MKSRLSELNKHSFNSFTLRIGLSIGPLGIFLHPLIRGYLINI